MSQPAARIGDPHICALLPSGAPVAPPCEVTVLTEKRPQARMLDNVFCVPAQVPIVFGSPTVLVGKRPAARMGDPTLCGGAIMMGAFTVLIGMVGVSVPDIGSFAMTMVNMPIEGGDVDPKEMAEAMIGAARDGKPFCEQCMKNR
ncbi:hypothetical protein GCM10011371_20840 [Novosphingobium marinum]|uniref:Putative Zn-binding protein involved in type VI secretion n=1 Tax=Novosphingobium marinum TaxID=1514948 RepID=A0A7Y9Y050_9SPHN|nr:PAAR domain-containing protein [Novosphingobium marinum]NYH96196.1 putative Zn-binding protein involved in type VI secretion [Novosphingobium marinum]GGC33232.1 hypothetical protein GCM10011371_20840 [Novosphingobium marinum]